MAMAQVCRARLDGAFLHSTELMFAPQVKPQAANYDFDVSNTLYHDNLGSITLLAQMLILPLAFADAPSWLHLKGGTHVKGSPPFEYLAHVFLPILEHIGFSVELELESWGFHGKGGIVTGKIMPLSSPLKPLHLVKRGMPKTIWTSGGHPCKKLRFHKGFQTVLIHFLPIQP